MSTLLVAGAGQAWAQDKPARPADAAGENAGDQPASGEFEGADHMMEGGALGGEGAGARPWAEGVSAQEQEAARVLFEEGNALLRESLFPQAVKKYREALEHWDHPGIHFNLSLALLNLDQPIAVYRSLEKAMQYGVGPIDKEKLERAQRYKEMVSQQIGTVEIVCNEPQAKVTLDGRPVLTGPGTYKNLVVVGEHQIVASKSGYINKTIDFVTDPAEQETVEVTLISIADMTVSKRRWATWMPWAAVGAGAAVLAVGGALHGQSSSSFADFDKSFDARCMNGGCNDGEVPDLKEKLDSAERQQQIAVTSYIIGGAAVVGGLVLVYVNRPQVYRRDLEAGTESQLSIVPVIAPDSAGVSAAFRF
jgi:hypothetical protein